jgi:uncharacterized protein YaiE (UPF0345 family)
MLTAKIAQGTVTKQVPANSFFHLKVPENESKIDKFPELLMH